MPQNKSGASTLKSLLRVLSATTARLPPWEPWPFFPTNSRPYAFQTGHATSAVGADVFAQITEIAEITEIIETIVQFAVSADLATLMPSLLRQHGLAPMHQRTGAGWHPQSCMKAARMHASNPAHGPHGEHQPVLGKERIPHPLPPPLARKHTCRATGSACLHAREGGLPGEVRGCFFQDAPIRRKNNLPDCFAVRPNPVPAQDPASGGNSHWLRHQPHGSPSRDAKTAAATCGSTSY